MVGLLPCLIKLKEKKIVLSHNQFDQKIHVKMFHRTFCI